MAASSQEDSPDKWDASFFNDSGSPDVNLSVFYANERVVYANLCWAVQRGGVLGTGSALCDSSNRRWQARGRVSHKGKEMSWGGWG